MTTYYLNCFTVGAYYPRSWQTGALCMLMETNRGLLLVDTGPGLEDYVRTSPMMRAMRVVTKMPMDPDETAAQRVTALGYNPQDVRDVVLTHMHFDHCGGLPDLPDARVHVHRREFEAFSGAPRSFLDLAYVQRHLAHQPEMALYDEAGERWFDFSAIRLPFDPEMWLVPLFGHSRGHCGVVVKMQIGWHFHVGGAAPIGFSEEIPDGLARLIVGPHASRLRAFREAHPEIRMTTGHMPLSFFEQDGS